MASGKVASWEQFYDGSRSFQFVAEATKMPIDQVNFILGQLFAVTLSFVLRTRFAPASYGGGKEGCSATQRHLFSLGSGLAITYFCFGKQVLLAVSLGLACYSLLLASPPTSVQRVTLIVCMTLLSAAHVYRQAMQQAAFVIDITGPMMLMVQRATSVAFALHDGVARDRASLTKMQHHNAIQSVPSLLEYLSYLLSFQSILAGPFLLYRDYQDYITGHDEYARAVVLHQSVATVDGATRGGAPRPTAEAGRKLLLAGLFTVSTVLVAPRLPVHVVTEAGFTQLSFMSKLLVVIVSTTLARHLYYTAWLLAEAVCNMGGLGYTGTDTVGRHTWHGASNVDIWGVEFGTSLRTTLDSWNRKTVIWLRYAAYERLAPKYQVGGTYLLSSMWHGYYPGYYCTFSTAAVVTVAARTVRRSIRPLVLSAAGGEARPLMQAYHVITWGVARLLLSYCTCTFVLLRWWPSIQVYRELYFYVHVLSLLAIFVLPLIITPPKKPKPDTVKVDDDLQSDGKKEL